MGIGAIGGTYCNLVFGTGSEEIGKALKSTIKNRKAHGLSYPKAITTGLSRGIKKSYSLQKRNGGYFKNLVQQFKAIPKGWKNGKGFFGKPWGAIKGCGKAMPALMAGIMVLGEIPNVYRAVRDKGVVQGLKEVGKTATRLTTGAICAAIGSALIPIPLVGSMAGWMLGDWIGSKIVGKSYSEQIAENKENTENKEPENGARTVTNADGDSVTFSETDPTANVEDIKYPSIHADDFGPYRPYANVFYNYPGAGADMGVSMPGQSNSAGGMNIASGGFGGVGMAGRNNVSPNLLDKVKPGGNLLEPTNR